MTQEAKGGYPTEGHYQSQLDQLREENDRLGEFLCKGTQDILVLNTFARGNHPYKEHRTYTFFGINIKYGPFIMDNVSPKLGQRIERWLKYPGDNYHNEDPSTDLVGNFRNMFHYSSLDLHAVRTEEQMIQWQRALSQARANAQQLFDDKELRDNLPYRTADAVSQALKRD